LNIALTQDIISLHAKYHLTCVQVLKIYHGLQRGELCVGGLIFFSCDEIYAVFRVIFVEDTDPISRVRLVEAGNTGETRSGEGGGDGNGIITGCKGVMYGRLSALNKGTVGTEVLALFP